MEERERRRGPRTRGGIRGPGQGRAGARDSSEPLPREGGRPGARGSSDPLPREGGRGPREGRPGARDSSDPFPREGGRGKWEGRPRERDFSEPLLQEGGRAGPPIEYLSREIGRPPGGSSAGAPSNTLSREGARAPSDSFPRHGGRALGIGRSGAPSDPPPGEGSRAPGVERAGGPSGNIPGEGRETSRADRPGAPSEPFPREGGWASAPNNPLPGEGSQGPRTGVVGAPSNPFPGEDNVPGPQLDVSSEHFDPLLVLYSPEVKLPFPEVRAFNNLAEYESFLIRGRRTRGPTVPKVRKGKKPPPDPERVQRLKNLIVASGEKTKPQQPRKGHRGPRNVLTRMPLNEGSPLGELHRCVEDRVRINVHIRTFKGMRGVCSGFLVAFDKFWNMALTDVDETYRKPVMGKAFYHEPPLTLTRLFDRLKLQDSSKTTSDAPTEPRELKSSTSKADSRYGSTSRRYDTDRRSNRNHGARKEDLHETPDMQDVKTLRTKQGESRSSTGTKVQTLTRPTRPKVDYQQVHSRHINQMFIRGENILLIHLAN